MLRLCLLHVYLPLFLTRGSCLARGLLDLFTQEELDSNLAASAREGAAKESMLGGYDDPQLVNASSSSHGMEGIGGTINAIPTNRPNPDENAPPYGHWHVPVTGPFYADAGTDVSIPPVQHGAPQVGANCAWQHQPGPWEMHTSAAMASAGVHRGMEDARGYDAGVQQCKASQDRHPLLIQHQHLEPLPPAGAGSARMPQQQWSHLHPSQHGHQHAMQQHQQVHFQQQQQLAAQQHNHLQYAGPGASG